MKNILLYLSLCISVIFTEASATTKVSGFIENVRVRTWVTYIKLSECKKYSKIYLKDDYHKAMFSTALTAFTAGKSVEVGFEGDDKCADSENELTVQYIDIQK